MSSISGISSSMNADQEIIELNKKINEEKLKLIEKINANTAADGSDSASDTAQSSQQSGSVGDSSSNQGSFS
jgi:hypothetical protein